MRNSAPTLGLLSWLVSSLASQGYTTGFESPTFTASSAGTPCLGQDGFYTPPVASSFDGAIYDYATNTIGVPTNANGGANFYAGINVSGLVRAQRSLTVPANSRCVIQFDVLCNFTGTALATANYLGGFSLQPSAVITPQFPTVAVYSNLVFSWPTTTVPPTVFDVVAAYGPTAGSVITPIPNPAFQGLAVNVWHTLRITLDLRTKEYVNWSVTNGVTNITTTYTPPAPVPLPNQASTYMPTDFRLFTGGGVGNLVAFDNVTVTYGATYDAFGAGCPGALGVPTLAATPGSSPTIGTTLSVDLGNLPLNAAIMMTGFSDTLAFGAVPLPFDLTSSGFPGCNVLVDPLVTGFFAGAGNTANWSLTIPGSTSYLGVLLFNQGLSLDTGPTGAAFSNGGRCVIGL